jgi:SPP1 gp7 family putative phage head morphogenesis protein
MRLVTLPSVFIAPRRVQAPARARLAVLDWPEQQELRYQSELLALSHTTSLAIRAEVLPKLPRLLGVAESVLRTDSMVDDLRSIFGTLRRKYGVPVATARKWALEMLDGVSKQHARQMAGKWGHVLELNPLLGDEPWLNDAMRVALQENVALITSIPEKQFIEVERLVSSAVLSGTRAEDLTSYISDRFAVSESRALLIARDQTGKWHGQLQRVRQLDAGIDRYWWSSSRDERVRKAHQAREGKVFRWDTPPEDGPPGIPVNCRCSAVPVVDEQTPDGEQT